MTISKPGTDRTSATGPVAPQRKGSARSLGLLALLPIACCGLPLLLAAVAAAGTGTILGGGAGLVLLVAAVVLAVVMLRRRRHAACRTDVGRPSKATKGCC